MLLLLATRHSEIQKFRFRDFGRGTFRVFCLVRDACTAALVVRHSGAQEKVRGYMAVEPDTGRGVVVLTNSEYGKPASIANAILELLREEPEP